MAGLLVGSSLYILKIPRTNKGELLKRMTDHKQVGKISEKQGGGCKNQQAVAAVRRNGIFREKSRIV